MTKEFIHKLDKYKQEIYSTDITKTRVSRKGTCSGKEYGVVLGVTRNKKQILVLSTEIEDPISQELSTLEVIHDIKLDGWIPLQQQ